MCSTLSKDKLMVLVDRSHSMEDLLIDSKSKWCEAKDSINSLVKKVYCKKNSNITLIPFANSSVVYNSVTPTCVDNVLKSVNTAGATDLATALKAALDNHLRALDKSADILVVIGSSPRPCNDVSKILNSFSKTISGTVSGIHFFQVGDDKKTSEFFKDLKSSFTFEHNNISATSFEDYSDLFEAMFKTVKV